MEFNFLLLPPPPLSLKNTLSLTNSPSLYLSLSLSSLPLIHSHTLCQTRTISLFVYNTHKHTYSTTSHSKWNAEIWWSPKTDCCKGGGLDFPLWLVVRGMSLETQPDKISRLIGPRNLLIIAKNNFAFKKTWNSWNFLLLIEKKTE